MRNLLDIRVILDACLDVRGEAGSATMICFHGDASSELFTGTILQGGVDTQIEYAGQKRVPSARYTLEGTDYTGQKCRIFIQNEGAVPDPFCLFHTTPRIFTDSENLRFLETAGLQGIVQSTDTGVRILIYDQTPVQTTEEEHWFRSGGRKIYGKIVKPVSEEGDGDGRHPLVILCHGYNATGDSGIHLARYWAEHGVAGIVFDFCGGGVNSRSDGQPAQMSIETEKQDLRDVLEEAMGFDWVRQDQVYLFGSSQGGLICSLVAPAYREQVRGEFLQFPALCVGDDWHEMKKNFSGREFECMGMMLGRRFLEELPEGDVAKQAAEYPGKVLIFHGDQDSLVKVGYSRHLHACMPNSELDIYPDEIHGFTEHYEELMMQKILGQIRMNM